VGGGVTAIGLGGAPGGSSRRSRLRTFAFASLKEQAHCFRNFHVYDRSKKNFFRWTFRGGIFHLERKIQEKHKHVDGWMELTGKCDDKIPAEGID